MSLLRNAFANGVGQLTTAALALAFIPVYVRVLGPEGYGLIGLYSALYAVLGILDSSFQATMLRSAATSIATDTANDLVIRVRTFEYVLLLLGLIIITLAFAGAEYVATQVIKRSKLLVDDISLSLFWMGVALAFRLFEGLYRGCLMGLERQLAFNVINIMIHLLRWGGVAAVLVWVSPTVQAFFMYQACIALVGSFALAAVTHKIVMPSGRARSDWRILWGDRRFMGGMLVISAAAVLLTQIDKLLLAQLLPLSDFGIYALAATAAGALTLSVAPIVDALHPRLVTHHAASLEHEFAATYHLGAQLVTMVAGTLALLAILYAEDIFVIWTGDRILAEKASPLFQILVLGNLMNAFMWMPYRAQLAIGWTRLSATINVIATVALVPLLLVTAPRYGALGAAWIWVGLNTGYVFLGARWMYRKLLKDEMLEWYVRDLLQPIATVALVAYGLHLLAVYFQQRHEPVFVLAWIFMSVLSCIAAAGLTSRSMRTILFRGVWKWNS